MAVSVRMNPLMERELELAARRQGISKSRFIIAAVERALGHRDPLGLLHQVQEEMAAYKVQRPASGDAPPSALQKKLRSDHAAQQSQYAALLKSRKSKVRKSKP
jgi:RHH-type rel operon transcriptional repressor/antitoxin RelB